MIRHHVVLVPGFFGFGSLGELTYFVGVKPALERAFQRSSLNVEVVEVPTLPTASLRHRAARVHETLAGIAEAGAGPIHIIGHSTGGLDARLAIAPTASLPVTKKFYAHERLRTLVTICAPHFGTPLASFFGSVAGYPLLKLVAGVSTSALTHAHVPIGIGLRVLRWMSRADDLLGFEHTIADDLLGRVIADFSPERRAELIAFIDGIAKDQSLIFQLTPAGCDLINACTADPDSLRYGSVVCSAPPPRVSSLIALKHNPYAQSMHALYVALHRILSATSDKERYPDPVLQQRRALEAAFGQYPEPSWSDGIVPTLSQIWGEVIHGARADHLDVVGHYGSRRRERATSDWIPSRSGFDDAAFEALWSTVAAFITEEAYKTDVPRHRANVGVERTQIERAELDADGDDAARAPRSKRWRAPQSERRRAPSSSRVVTANEQARGVLEELPEQGSR